MGLPTVSYLAGEEAWQPPSELMDRPPDVLIAAFAKDGEAVVELSRDHRSGPVLAVDTTPVRIWAVERHSLVPDAGGAYRDGTASAAYVSGSGDGVVVVAEGVDGEWALYLDAGDGTLPTRSGIVRPGIGVRLAGGGALPARLILLRARVTLIERDGARGRPQRFPRAVPRGP
jgi:hypothetical protein